MTQPSPKTVFAKNRLNRLVIRVPGTVIRLVRPNGKPIAQAGFTLIKANGECFKETLDDQGCYKFDTQKFAPSELAQAVIIFDQGVAVTEDEFNALSSPPIAANQEPNAS